MFYSIVNLRVLILIAIFLLSSLQGFSYKIDFRANEFSNFYLSSLADSNEESQSISLQQELKRSVENPTPFQLDVSIDDQTSFQFSQQTISNSFPNVSFSGFDLKTEASVFLNSFEDKTHIYIFAKGDNFLINGDEEEGWSLQKINEKDFPSEATPREFSSQNNSPTYQFQTDDEGNVIIKILFLYTQGALSKFSFDTAELELFISDMITTSNTILESSKVHIRLQAIHSEELNSFIETTSSKGIEADLTRLRSDEEVRDLKSTYQADIVTLLGDYDQQVCGIATVITVFTEDSMDEAYNIVDKECAILNLTFPHEIGHNMGLRHDIFVDEGDGAFRYSHGYVKADKGWRTILAYNDECAQDGFSCDRIPYFSNASLEYFGSCLGDSFANNRKSLNNIRYLLTANSNFSGQDSGESESICSSSAADDDSNPDKGCFLSSIAVGSTLEKKLPHFRNFRDQWLKDNWFGRKISFFYYELFSPWIGNELQNTLIGKIIFYALYGITFIFNFVPTLLFYLSIVILLKIFITSKKGI